MRAGAFSAARLGCGSDGDGGRNGDGDGNGGGDGEDNGNGNGGRDTAPRPRSAAALAILALAAVVAFAGFAALGHWQLQRRAWKHELIARVAQRVHAAPAPAPGRSDWPSVSVSRDEYRRVTVAGRFLHERAALVRASTRLGAGYWVLAPLRRRPDGSLVLVNRGFVPAGPDGRADIGSVAAAGPDGEVTVTGLLRLPEPGGGFLRRNDPAADRWFSRDVQAIAASRRLGGVAPYFIDAQSETAEADVEPDGAGSPTTASPASAPASSSGVALAAAATAPAAAPVGIGARPVGSLTVIDFPDNHLVYAVTWYSLALMVAAAAVHVARYERRLRSGGRARTVPIPRRRRLGAR